MPEDVFSEEDEELFSVLHIIENCPSNGITEDGASAAGTADEIESIAMESFRVQDQDSSVLESLQLGSVLESLPLGSLESAPMGSLISMSTDGSDQWGNNYLTIHESLSTRLLRVCDAQQRYGEHSSQFVAIKLLLDEFPAPSQICRLQNEFKVSQHLSTCASTRSALKVTSNEGFHAIYLEWAEGTTLREWIQAQQIVEKLAESETHVDYESAIRLALEISKALEAIHQSGVVHNNLAPDNIIVDVDKAEGTFSVKIIDLGLASVVDNKNSPATDDHTHLVETDIVSLGAVFYELFSGKNPYQKEYSSSSCVSNVVIDEEQGQPSRPHLPCMDSNVPMCLSTLVSKLTRIKGQQHTFHSVTEVITEIQSMLETVRQCPLGVSDLKNLGRIKFPEDKLYGRDSHMGILMDAYKRVSQPVGKSETLFISGYSGSGKTALVQDFRRLLSSNNATFISGKYDKFRQMEPLSAIITAFTEFCEKLTANDDDGDSQQKRSAIKEAVGSESNVLEQLMPSLREITGTPIADIVNAGCIEAQNRFKYIFRLLVRAIASSTHPLVFCLDDLQWIDLASLELMKSLITDSMNSSLLLIGLYRENEVTDSHPLRVLLDNVTSQEKIINNIKVENLSRIHVNELLSDTLKMSPGSTQPFADVVYRKTGGSALVVRQFLISLCDEGLLSYSFNTQKWRWDVESTESKNISDDVVELVTQKVLRLSEEAQSAMKVVACLGSLSEELLGCIGISMDAEKNDVRSIQCFNTCRDRSNLLKWLNFSVSEGLLDFKNCGYSFAHDQIQNTVYSLIPEDMRGLWHLQLGSQILANKDSATDQAMFTAVSQLNQGVASLKEKYQRIELAGLNLQAGEKAMSLAVYHLAASYLELGMSLLGEKCWEDHYHLSLNLYVSCAETHYCIGNFEKMNKMLDTIFSSAKCFSDKLRAYFIQVRALGAQLKMQEVLKVSLFVLENLGEEFPTSVDKRIIGAEFTKTNQMLDGKTDTDILELNASEDDKKTAAIQMLNILVFICMSTKSKYAPLFAFRMVQLTLSYGLCDESAFGFASFAFALRGIFHRIKEAYFYGEVALTLVKKFNMTHQTARVFGCVLTGVSSWAEPHQNSIEALKYGYKAGMRCGDVQSASLCAMQYCVHSFQCGEELSNLEKAMKMYAHEMIEHKQELFRRNLQVYRQLALNLMGQADDPLKLSGEAMDKEQMLKVSREKKQMLLSFVVYQNCSLLAYIYGSYELASQMAEKAATIQNSSMSSAFAVGSHTFIHGLISCVLARKSDETNLISIVDDSIEKMKNWAEHAPSNFEHKLLLLQAESAFLSGVCGDAAIKYDMAITKAGENGFIHEQAIAYELAGAFHCTLGNSSKASQYYGQAHDTYLKWGAHGKADHLRLNYPF